MKITTYIISVLAISLTACGGGGQTNESDTQGEATAEETTQEAPAAEPVPDPQNIVELAVGSESLSTLVAAVTAGELVETLSGEGPFTVFAPTNEAFNALPEGTLDELLKPENNDQLVSILTYHVVAGKVLSSDLSDGMTATTVNGAEITITTTDGAKVNGASVVSADIEASNGVVHVIDAVILPPSE